MSARLLLRQSRAVAAREMHQLLATPLFWVLSGVFFLAASLVYIGLVSGFSDPAMREENDISSDVTLSVVRQTFWVLHYFLMVQAPMLTMRAIAEERRQGTLSLLQTTCAGEWSIALGKFAANCGALCIFVVLTLAFPLLTAWISDPWWPVVGSCYAALLLAACAYTAVGIFFSSLTESQVVAAVLTYVTLFGLVVVGQLADAFSIANLTQITRHLTPMAHVDGFLEGNVATADVAYFVLFTVVFLFFTVRVLESARWRN